MILRNFFDPKLAQASYLVACAATGEAIVIDPLRDIAQYVSMAESLGVRITAVTETHIHADYLSGTRELAAATGARMFLSDEGDELWKYAFADDARVTLVRHGDVITIGNLSLRVMHTPGHTPEHIAFLLIDHPMGELPHSLFSGDFIFVGDVGRPDLLERAANFQGTMEKGARVLFQSIQKLADLPDSLLVWPAHGAGSACGKSLGGSPVTTLGYERATNWAFQVKTEDKFVDEVLSGQPEPPVYFKEMKRLNKLGPAVLGSLARVTELTEPRGQLIDVRESENIRNAMYLGSLAIPSGKGLTNWSGWLLAYDQPVTLIADSQEMADAAARDMATIGLDIVEGWIKPSALEQSRFESIHAIAPEDIRGDETILDVRGINEWNLVRMERATHIPLGYLRSRLDEVPRDKKIVVHCAAGGRSPIAMSILLNAGFHDVWEMTCGIDEVNVRRPELLART
ncbi:MAG: MBL fold metallo-hydrolase [Fimbriimonadaceae bacterium]|nr:MBL fold metallo-hydrolase [Fimbriimonadaceae bacterium]